MKRKNRCSFIILGFLVCLFLSSVYVKAHAMPSKRILIRSNTETNVDVLVVGGGTSGITAGIQSARMKVKTLILSESSWLGGMLTSAGVSAVDGNYRLPAGLWGEFRDSLSVHYGGLGALKTGWVSNVLFEPSVGNLIFHKMADKERKFLSVWENTGLLSLKHSAEGWLTRVKCNGVIRTVKAKIVIDATELGDVAKMCGVRYDIGMESRYDTKENIAPEKKNNIVQDLTYTAILKDYGHDVSISCPQGYRKEDFVCCCKNVLCTGSDSSHVSTSPEMMMNYGRLPNHKYMINWPKSGNDFYANIIEMTPVERSKVLACSKQHTLCFVYFLQHELGFSHIGLADDEFPTTDHLPLIPYYRESRRIHGMVRFTLNDLAQPYVRTTKLYRTCIAVGDYPVDHHHSCYKGSEVLPDLHFYSIPSYGLPLGTLIPKDVDNLIVAEKSISVSNLVNGTTRLQPVVMQIGQTAGTLAALAVQTNRKVSNIPVRDVQNSILDSKGYLLPYLDVPVSNAYFKSYQRIGSTGIMKGYGKSVDWSNEMWFKVDSVLTVSDLSGLVDYYPVFKQWIGKYKSDNSLSIGDAINLIAFLKKGGKREVLIRTIENNWSAYSSLPFDIRRKITRGEMSVLLDRQLDPFNSVSVDLWGNIHSNNSHK